ncbi:MAG TPA: A/G-specific adenine glycosylase [Candidatus Baltobacteraceae bacterium]
MTARAQALLAWYERHGRTHLPWRQTRDPYRVVVSEFMLQQTQVERVLPAYTAFIERFPDFVSLAAAPAGDVLRAWRGLGYNSRAIRLQRLAQEVVERHGGVMPRAAASLRVLPGVGPYTAAAIRAFAFNETDAAMDTNIRRIVHRTLFGVEFPPKASAAVLDARASDEVPPERGHDWNSAMMDLGSAVCSARTPKCLVCPLRDFCQAAPIDSARLAMLSAEYAPKRSPEQRIPFEQTTRFVRGRIIDHLRELPPGKAISLLDLHRELQPIIKRDEPTFSKIIRALAKDGVLEEGELGVTLPSAAHQSYPNHEGRSE